MVLAGRVAQMEQEYQTKFLPWLGFETLSSQLPEQQTNRYIRSAI